MLSEPILLRNSPIMNAALDSSEQHFDAFDALIMLQIASHAIGNAHRQMMHVQNALAPQTKNARRDSLNEPLALYVEALQQAEYEGCGFFGRDAGDYYFRLGATSQHMIVLHHAFDRFLDEDTDQLIVPDGNDRPATFRISDLLARKPNALAQIEPLMAGLARATLSIQHALYTFSAELERADPVAKQD